MRFGGLDDEKLCLWGQNVDFGGSNIHLKMIGKGFIESE